MTEHPESPAKRFLRRRPFLARCVLLATGFLLALLIAELALRVSGFTYFNPYIADQDLGFSLRPNAEGWWRQEGLTYVRINSSGFHDRERSLAKPPGTFRIAIVGDSYAEAFQVPLEKTFWSLMEQRLNQCQRFSSDKVEVLNFGISGFSTARELILLRKRVWQYSPDAIVLLITPGNDIRDNSRSLNEYSHQPLPYFVLQDGQLALDNSLMAARNNSFGFRIRRSFIGRSFDWLQRHWRLLGLIYTVRETLLSPGRPPSDRKQNTNLRVEDELGLDSEVYLGPLNREWSEAWELTEQLILQMRNEVEAHGAQFVAVVGGAAIQDNPNVAEREAFMKRLGVKNLSYPNERIVALGQRAGFKVLNLAVPFGDYARRTHTFLHGSGPTLGTGHWNESGHTLAGELIANELCAPLP